MCSVMNALWTHERKVMKIELVNAEIPAEPSRARLLSELSWADSYITTLPHAKDSFRAFAVTIA